ncbi:MAG: 4-vinyl reductase [Candidatus Diapherotrites archaeon]|nr:4-vinyl reductase [Candidatus Diapherotrites archaeon]
MHKKAEDLMFAELLRFSEDGKISLFAETAFLLPSEYILHLEEKSTPEELYLAAKKIPEPIITTLKEKGMKDIELLDFLLELLEVLGIGNIQVKKFDRNKKEYQLTINNSSTNKIKCHRTRGYLAAAFSQALGQELKCIESQCISEGANNCEFIIAQE